MRGAADFRYPRFGNGSEIETPLSYDSEGSYEIESTSDIRFVEWTPTRDQFKGCLCVTFLSGIIVYAVVSVVVIILSIYGLATGLLSQSYNFRLQFFAAVECVQLVVAVLFHVHLIFFQRQLLQQGYLEVREKLNVLKSFPVTLSGIVCAVFLVCVAFKMRFVQLPLIESFVLLHHLGQFGIACWIFHLASIPSSSDATPDVARKLREVLDATEYNSSNSMDILASQSLLIDIQEDRLQFLAAEVVRLSDREGMSVKLEKVIQEQQEAEILLKLKEEEREKLNEEKGQVERKLEETKQEIQKLKEELGTISRVSRTQKEEISKHKLSNSQFVEENNRLRSMLDEWSARCLKLEIAIDHQSSIIEKLQHKLEAANIDEESSENS